VVGTTPPVFFFLELQRRGGSYDACSGYSSFAPTGPRPGAFTSPPLFRNEITRTKTGRTVSVNLSVGPMQEAMAWLQRYERFWTVSLDRLVALVEKDDEG
jgi:hypothetical protein